MNKDVVRRMRDDLVQVVREMHRADDDLITEEGRKAWMPILLGIIQGMNNER